MKFKENQKVYIIACNIINEYQEDYGSSDIICKTRITRIFEDENDVAYYYFNDIENPFFINSARKEAWRYEDEIFKNKEEAVNFLNQKGIEANIRSQDIILKEQKKKQHVDKILYKLRYNLIINSN